MRDKFMSEKNGSQNFYTICWSKLEESWFENPIEERLFLKWSFNKDPDDMLTEPYILLGKKKKLELGNKKLMPNV